MIAELAAVWQQIIIRAAIMVGLITAVVIGLSIAAVALTVRLIRRWTRRWTPDAVEYDEAA